jgi:hypothetical protein
MSKLNELIHFIAESEHGCVCCAKQSIHIACFMHNVLTTTGPPRRLATRHQAKQQFANLLPTRQLTSSFLFCLSFCIMPMLMNEVSLLQVTCRLRSRSPKSITGAQSKSIYFTEITNSFVDIF